MKINARKKSDVYFKQRKDQSKHIYIDGQQIEQVREFRYLGSLISDDGYCAKEIASRIGMAKEVFQDKRKLFTGKMNLELKIRIVKCLVWSVATYAAETWTLREVDRKKIEAFEMWIWRRMEKISWRDKITNDDALKRVNEERSLLNEIWQRKQKWIGHFLRHDSFLQAILEGRMLGKRTRGRRQMQMLHDLTANSDYVTLKQTAAESTMRRYSRGISRTCSTAKD